jgi:hypothetical protein
MDRLQKKEKRLEEYNRQYSDSLPFTSRAPIIHRIGGELIKDSQTAVSELVKNCYDADASRVDITFYNLGKETGKIVIGDNGSGMSKDDIQRKWMSLSTDDKIMESTSPIFGRVRLGAKGIGRFAVDKLGSKLILVTKKEDDPYSLKMEFNWDEYDNPNRDLDEITNPSTFLEPEPGFHHGAKLIIKGLIEKWTKNKIRNIIEELSQLIDPEEKDQNFEITINSNDYPDLTLRLSNPLAGKETHRIDFEIDKDGNYVRTVLIENYPPKKHTEHRDPLICGPVRGSIRYYSKGIKSSSAKLSRTEIRDKPETHTGIKIRRDKCRVRPYGEVTDDWLEIKALRSVWGGKSPIRHNYISGTIYLSRNDNPALIDSTDRESLQENDAFWELKKFVMDHLDILSEMLLEEEKVEQKKKREENLKKVLDYCSLGLNKQQSDEYKNTIDMLDKKKKGEFDIGTKGTTKTTKKAGEVRNEIWECLECSDRWKVPIGTIPTKCREFSVRTDGTYVGKEGCGSTRIKKYERQEMPVKGSPDGKGGRKEELIDIIQGAYAIVSGKMLTPQIDWTMKEEDDEVEFRENDRIIAVNASHISYRIAEILDRKEGAYYQIGEDKLPPALSTHIIKCICLAWARFHARKSGKIEEFDNRYDELKDDIFNLIRSDIEISSRYDA